MKSRIILISIIALIVVTNFLPYITLKALIAELRCQFISCTTTDRIYRAVPEKTTMDIINALDDIYYYELGGKIAHTSDPIDENLLDTAESRGLKIGFIQSLIYPLLPIALYIVWQRRKTNSVDTTAIIQH